MKSGVNPNIVFFSSMVEMIFGVDASESQSSHLIKECFNSGKLLL